MGMERSVPSLRGDEPQPRRSSPRLLARRSSPLSALTTEGNAGRPSRGPEKPGGRAGQRKRHWQSPGFIVPLDSLRGHDPTPKHSPSAPPPLVQRAPPLAGQHTHTHTPGSGSTGTANSTESAAFTLSTLPRVSERARDSPSTLSAWRAPCQPHGGRAAQFTSPGNRPQLPQVAAWAQASTANSIRCDTVQLLMLERPYLKPPVRNSGLRPCTPTN